MTQPETTKPTASSRFVTILLIVIATAFGLVLLLFVAVLFLPGSSRPAAPAARTVTMDGLGPSGALDVPLINLSSTYEPRGRTTGQARHGERVTLLQQSGAGCEVQTATGARGWVTCANFIKELK